LTLLAKSGGRRWRNKNEKKINSLLMKYKMRRAYNVGHKDKQKIKNKARKKYIKTYCGLQAENAYKAIVSVSMSAKGSPGSSGS